MKKLRILSIIVFVAAAVSFGMYRNEQINSKDNQAPKITMKKDSIKVSCDADQKKLLKGIKAKDSKDGDVTDSLIIESISNFTKNKTRSRPFVDFFKYSIIFIFTKGYLQILSLSNLVNSRIRIFEYNFIIPL